MISLKFHILILSHLLTVSDFNINIDFLTERQFKARVEQQEVESGIFGATDLIIRHDDLRVQCEPLSWTLLCTERHIAADPQMDEYDENMSNLEKVCF